MIFYLWTTVSDEGDNFWYICEYWCEDSSHYSFRKRLHEVVKRIIQPSNILPPTMAWNLTLMQPLIASVMTLDLKSECFWKYLILEEGYVCVPFEDILIHFLLEICLWNEKLIHFIILIFIIACGSEPDYQEVMVNKTVKVYSKD